MAAAERLFAGEGIDGVSLREINRAAGARNAIAVQYHFEDRRGVLEAIMDKHRPEVEARRHAMLDQYEADGVPGLRKLAAALVRPAASKLTDPDGGPEYLQISAELLNRARAPISRPSEGSPDSMSRWRAAVMPLLAPGSGELHRRFTTIRFAAMELGRRARSGPHADDRLFISHLIDLVGGLLAVELSEETQRLHTERDNAMGRRSAQHNHLHMED